MEKILNSTLKLKIKYNKEEFEKKKIKNFICQGILIILMINLEICILRLNNTTLKLITCFLIGFWIIIVMISYILIYITHTISD